MHIVMSHYHSGNDFGIFEIALLILYVTQNI